MEYPDWDTSRRGRRGWAPAGTWSAVGPSGDDPAEDFHGGDWLRPTEPDSSGHPSNESSYGRAWVPRQRPVSSHDPWEAPDPGGSAAPRGAVDPLDPRHVDPPRHGGRPPHHDPRGRPDGPEYLDPRTRPDDPDYLDPRSYLDFGEAPDAPEDPRARWEAGRVLDDGEWYEEPSEFPPARSRTGARDRLGRPGQGRRTGAGPATRTDGAAEEESNGRGYVAALVATATWYLTPIALYLLWTLTLGSTRDVSCVEASGEPCPAPRTEALATLVDNAPQLATALALSLALALALQWMTTAWRTVTVGFAAAVVGAGITTVLFSLFT